MTVKNKKVIKFTRAYIESVDLERNKYETGASITLKTGIEIRSHSLELEKLILNKYKSYVAFGAVKHMWLSNNNGEAFKV